jgi:hypothetical protein
MKMKKAKNLIVMALMVLVLSIAACGGGSSGGNDDNTPVPEGTIYNAAGDWTINAVYAGDQIDECSGLSELFNQTTVTIEKSSDTTYTITFSSNIGPISVTAARQGNTLTYNGPVYYGTEQIGTVDGRINITSDTTFEGSLTLNGSYQSITCQDVLFNVTGNKNTSN